MSKEVIAILRALTENDRVRRRQLAAFAVLFLAMIATLLWIGHLGSTPNSDFREMLVWSVIAMVVAAPTA
jgi:hypothetical protein